MTDAIVDRTSDSRQTQIAKLEVGECHTLTRRIPFDMLPEQSVIDTIERLRNVIAAATTRAKHQTGNSYVVESGAFAAPRADAMFVCVIVTRIS